MLQGRRRSCAREEGERMHVRNVHRDLLQSGRAAGVRLKVHSGKSEVKQAHSYKIQERKRK